jgi:hypothetical protein
MNSLPARVVSLVAAYALALQALLSAMTPATPLLTALLTAQLANAPALAVASLAVICSTSGSDQPADHDQAPCTLHCLLASGGGAGVAPPGAAIVAFVAPTAIRIAMPQAPHTLGRATAKRPQLPRAPPLA